MRNIYSVIFEKRLSFFKLKSVQMGKVYVSFLARVWEWRGIGTECPEIQSVP